MYSDKRVRWKRDRIEKEIPGKRRKLEPSPGQRPLLRLESVWEEDLKKCSASIIELYAWPARRTVTASRTLLVYIIISLYIYCSRCRKVLVASYSVSPPSPKVVSPKPELKQEPPATTRRLHPPSLAFLVQAGLKQCSNQSTAANPPSHKHDHSRSLSPSSQLRSLSHLPFVSLGRVANLTARDTPLSSARVSAQRSVFVTLTLTLCTKRLLSNASAQPRPYQNIARPLLSGPRPSPLPTTRKRPLTWEVRVSPTALTYHSIATVVSALSLLEVIMIAKVSLVLLPSDNQRPVASCTCPVRNGPGHSC